eukprot:CAMPEP_0119562840 /NCGR_PEP_ID=MMETSP1352-20130426/21730_1 /TAXON_ID=265584 /ORGANISM="Stauroneis constricta, Strain CCMP1120" /LENGTH=265 /DNA_ID=CAMNT_0007611335 /DNA_START=118 /DNA_END=912 /DNA_ORIENTATION=-
MMMSVIERIAPPSNVLGYALTAFQLFAISAIYKEERNAPAQYSKFANDAKKKPKDPVPSRVGMMIIYTPAFLVSLCFQFVPYLPKCTAALLLTIHFAKRCFEVLFIHKYSGSVPKAKAIEISTLYSLTAAIVCYYAVPVGANDDAFLTVGQVAFVIGQIGNFYHHYLLASLRKKKTGNDDKKSSADKKYVPPTGGFFSLGVTAPHYFFELMAWFGIACVAQQVNAFGAFIATIMYLTARAKNQFDWNAMKFSKKEWDPATKTYLI